METSASKTIAIVGLNASGKTQFVERLRRETASSRLRYIAFIDSYGAATDRQYYLQLRWNHHDIDEETPRVTDLLERSFMLTGSDTSERRNMQNHLYELFHLKPLLDKYIIFLSSGELRKFQMVKTLMAAPEILILDNPFIGLDAETRQQLSQVLYTLVNKEHLTLYLVLSRKAEVPAFVDETIWITDQSEMNAPAPHLPEQKRQAIIQLPTKADDYQADIVVGMKDVSVSYGNHHILSRINWNVRQGERWALSGKNGSGKSTLLSLINADNPQAYACDITLFGHQRGSGETIWDIKRHIGYVSPEMHRSYQRNIPTLNIIASGLKDTIGLYIHVNEKEKEQCRWWMRIFGIEHLEDRPFLQLSSGEQRMVLLARAFVKDPELIILDEPFHGLDDYNQQLAKDIICAFCERPNKTLILVTHYEAELPSCITHYKRL